MALICPTCSGSFASLQKHFGASPACDPWIDCVPLLPPPQGSGSGCSYAHSEKERVFEQRFTHKVMHDYNDLHHKRFIGTAACDAWHGTAIGWIDFLKSEVLQEAANGVAAVEAVFASAERALVKLQSSAHRDAYNIKVLKAPYVEPEPYDKGNAEQFRKTAAKLSLIKLLGRWMQHDSFYRKHCIERSEKWKTGELHNKKPESIADVTDGMKVRKSDMMRKATAEEAYDVRIGKQVSCEQNPRVCAPRTPLATDREWGPARSVRARQHLRTVRRLASRPPGHVSNSRLTDPQRRRDLRQRHRHQKG